MQTTPEMRARLRELSSPAHNADDYDRAVRALLADFETELTRLEGLVYVPGVWRCAKCDFRLIQSNLNASDGTVTARDTPGDKCPNCQSPLWRVTERQERTEALDMIEKGLERQCNLRSVACAVRDDAAIDQVNQRIVLADIPKWNEFCVAIGDQA